MSAPPPTRDDDALVELLDDLGAVAPSPHLRERLLRATLGNERFPPALRAAAAAALDLDDAGLAALLERVNRAGEWEAGPLPGFSLLLVDGAQDGKLRSVARLDPGMAFPSHTHLGREHMLVLEGGLVADDGRRCGPGDALVSEAGSRHAFLVDPDGDCLAVVILEGGVDFGV